ncbi:MAG: methyltransferase [Alistipes sp.]|nr:methyltransferase [Alistipes sp.]
MFRFRGFEVRDELCAMKVGTDGVLIGAWARVEDASTILDVGTGSGLIALMAAQRNTQARIMAIDIDSEAVAQARINADNSPWSERIVTERVDVTQWSTELRFDHIVSNPPYFVDALHCPDAQRNMARHTITLDFEALVASACRLLNANGRLSVILPTDGAASFRRAAFEKLWLTRQCDIAIKEGEEPRRTMMEFMLCDTPQMPRCSRLTMHDRSGGYSEEYRALTSAFYLNF